MTRLETTLLLNIGGGDAEAEFQKLIVEYRYIPFSRGLFERGGGQLTPDEPEQAEIGRVYVVEDGAETPLPERWIERLNDHLERMCLADHRGRDEYARERAAEMRREDRAPVRVTKAAE